MQQNNLIMQQNNLFIQTNFNSLSNDIRDIKNVLINNRVVKGTNTEEKRISI